MKDMQCKGKVVVIAGPTGSGESTITEMVMRRIPGSLRLITATTRPPRKGEIEGESYIFMGTSDFEEGIRSGTIVEHTYIESRNVYYGTYKPVLEDVLQRASVVFANLDLVGMRFFRDTCNAVTVFVHPGSFNELGKRIKLRNPEMTKEELEKRLVQAKNEIDTESSEYTHHIVNADGKLDEAVEHVLAILKKEGYSTHDE